MEDGKAHASSINSARKLRDEALVALVVLDMQAEQKLGRIGSVAKSTPRELGAPLIRLV